MFIKKNQKKMKRKRTFSVADKINTYERDYQQFGKVLTPYQLDLMLKVINKAQKAKAKFLAAQQKNTSGTHFCDACEI